MRGGQTVKLMLPGQRLKVDQMLRRAAMAVRMRKVVQIPMSKTEAEGVRNGRMQIDQREAETMTVAQMVRAVRRLA